MNIENPGFEIFLRLQSTTLVCHSFKDDGKRHDAPESETKDLITHHTAGRMGINVAPSNPLAPQIPQGRCQGVHVDPARGVSLHHS